MAQLVPGRGLITQASGRFKLKFHEIAPEHIVPNGDRYIVEVIDLDETVQLGSLLVVTQAAKIDPQDPMADPTIENRGVLAAVIISVGNGHLLGLPDPRVAVSYVTGGQRVERAPADVPMFFEQGDVVLLDYNAKGRALKIVNRECRVVNQIDVLAQVGGVKLRRVNDEWVVTK